MKRFFFLLLTAVSSHLSQAQVEWIAPLNNGNIVASIDFTEDANGDIISIGSFRATTVYPLDFDPSSGTFDLYCSTGYSDTYVQKLDASGGFLWARSFGYEFDDYAQAVITDSANNIYIAGNFEDTIDFDPGPGVYNVAPSDTNSYNGDMYLLKLSSDGDFIWVKTFEN